MPRPAILGPNGEPLRAAPRPSPPAARQWVRARYDAAQTTDDNTRHWANADNWSARAANLPEIRRVLRNRARYESANNSYCRGIVLTLANDTVGTGPRLQLRTGDDAVNAEVTESFEAWTCAVGLAEKLRTMRQSRAVDGEAFAYLFTNPRVSHPVKLDLKLVEADQIATPFGLPLRPQTVVDGLTLDEAGNVVSYNLLRNHPGDLIGWGLPLEYDEVPASLVLHWFRADRPLQYRGVPEITPALELFAQLRRYTQAVLAAAETAADFAAVLYTDMPPDGEAQDADPFESLDIAKRMMTTVPAGWKLGQFKAEQPATTYDMFKNAILNEIARCLNMPFNVAAGNSAGYNYSSGRLDHQVYYKSIGVDQYHAETALLNPLFTAWLAEARLTGEAPRDFPDPPRQWFWDGREHVDPVKEATAEQIRLSGGMTTLADVWARQGHDWRERLAQRAAEVALMTELGLPVPTPPAVTAAAVTAMLRED